MMEIQYLRPHKAKCAESAWNNYEDRTGQLKIQHYTNVNLKAMGQHPGIQTQNNRLIDDCDFYSEFVDTKDSTTSISGKVLYAGYFRKSWGHFLMNSTARLWPIFTEDVVYDKIVFFCESNEKQEVYGNFKEFLNLIGIEHKCIILPPATYHFEDLTVGEIALEIGRYYSSEFMQPFKAVRDSALATPNLTTERYKGIFLSRSQWNDNQLMQLNLNSIEEIFTNNGYKAIAPESTSLSDLIMIMESADSIVSFSGSTAHNVLFAGKKELIVLERCAANNIYQIAIAKMLGNKFVPVDCFYQPILVSSTDNLTIYGFTPQLRNFVSEYGMKTLIAGNTDSKREFRCLMKLFRRRYGYGVGLNSWEVSQLPAIAEAYFESYPRYSKYLERRVPVMWFDWFSPRVYIRMLRSYIHR